MNKAAKIKALIEEHGSKEAAYDALITRAELLEKKAKDTRRLAGEVLRHKETP